MQTLHTTHMPKTITFFYGYIPQLESWMSPMQSNILAINITAKDVLHAVHYKQDKVH